MIWAWLCACTATDTDTGASPAGETGVTTAATLEVEVTQPGASPVRRVRWRTAEPSTGAVIFGVGALDRQIDDPVVGTEHEVIVAGIGTGTAWQLQAISEVEGVELVSEVVDVAAVEAPPDLVLPSVTVEPSPGATGYTLAPIASSAGNTVTLFDRHGAAVWWAEPAIQLVFRARFDANTRHVHFIRLVPEDGSQVAEDCALDSVCVETEVPPNVHQDFALTPDGSLLTLVGEPREIDGTTVVGDTLREVSTQGETRILWSSWDHFTWDGTGKQNTDGTVEWPHANTVSYDAERDKAIVSLYYPGAVVQVDRATGAQDWAMGGTTSDWTIDVPFSGQHGAVVSAGGTRLLLVDNGLVGTGAAAVARAYDLDEGAKVAASRWAFDDAGNHEDLVMGDIAWLGDDAGAVVNWGFGGVVDEADAAGNVHWQLSFPLGSFAMFSENVTDLGDHARE